MLTKLVSMVDTMPLRRLRQLWRSLTEPSQSLTNPRDRRLAYALAAALLLFLTIGMFLIGLGVLFPSQMGEIRQVAPAVQLVLFVGYCFSRTRFYRVGTVLSLLVSRIACMMLALQNPALILLVMFIPITTMLSGFVLDIPILIGVTITDVVGILVLTFAIHLLPVSSGLLMLLLIVLSVILSLGAAMVRQRELNRLRQQAQYLRESESRFRLMADTAPVMIWTANANREYDYFNLSWLQFTGRSLNDEISSERVDGIYPEEQPKYWVTFISAFTEREPYQMTYRQKRQDGEYRWLLEKGSPRFLEDGTFIGYIGSCIDITDWIRAEQSAAEGERRYRSLFEQSGDAILILDLDTRIVAINDLGLLQFGYRREELIGRSATQFFSEMDTIPAVTRWDDLLAGKDIPTYTRLLRRKDGTDCYTEIKLSLIRALDGSLLYVQSILRDVTQRRRYEQEHLELLKQNTRVEVLRQFVSDVSHDLRTPLSIISTSSYLARRKLENVDVPEKVIGYLKMIDTQTQHLSRMVDDMLNISYLDSENAAFQMQPANLAEIARNLVDEVKASDSMGHKAIEFSAEPESVTVQGNATQLSRAIQGVLMNAVQYTSDEGQIQVRVSVADGLARVDIQDNGIGIHAKDLPHIFDHFYRSDSARPVKTGGAGVGLTISRKIIEMHGGQITVESQPGVGSTFHLLLPLRQVFANAILAD